MSRTVPVLSLMLVFLLASLLPAAAAPPDLKAAKATFTSTCAQCHGLDRPVKATKDAKGWKETIGRMSKAYFTKFAHPIPDADQEAIASYLVAKDLFTSACSRCHGVDRPLGTRKTVADWETTVKRMSGKAQERFGAAIPAEDQKTIVQYLWVESGI